MSDVSERLSAEFGRWEVCGRGWEVSAFPVSPEPLFRPFFGHGASFRPDIADDGRKTTLLSRFVRRISEQLTPAPKTVESEERRERLPECSRTEFVELQAILPKGLRFAAELYETFFTSLRVSREPISFELLSSAGRITAQFVLHPDDEALVRRQMETFFPSVVCISKIDALKSAWSAVGEGHAAVVEFGLEREFMIPLSWAGNDPLSAVIGALGGVAADELGLLQVIFEPVRHPWHKSIMLSVEDGKGGAFFKNAPELLVGAKEKIATSLYGVVLRVAAKSADFDRSWEITSHIACALGIYGSPTTNELIPLRNDDYPLPAHEEDVIQRQSRRSGMILNAEELAGFVHFPSEEIASVRLRAPVAKSKAAPSVVIAGAGVLLGTNLHLEQETEAYLSNDQRIQHTHIIGASGTGKSTLLYNLAKQDIERGEGVGILDPHGDLIDAILGIIPDSRIKDVVLLDPSDEQYAVGFNILSAHSDAEKNLLASDLVSVFRRLSSSWGDQMGSVLQNAILTFLEHPEGGTLVDLRRFLLDTRFREEFLRGVKDPEMVFYWKKAFPQLVGGKSIGPILTRLETFLSPKAIRHIVAQKENKLDFSKIMDGGKIFLAKLSHGAIGPENSYLLGSLLVAKIQQEAMSRQRQEAKARRDFFLYVDEFHNFLTASMAEILSGARKYRLALTLSHQEMRQIARDPDVESALLSNAYTRISFRVGDQDARELERGFSSFDASDLTNLGRGEAICRVERSSYDFNLAVAKPALPEPDKAKTRRDDIIWLSQVTYGKPRRDVESQVRPEEPAPAKVEMAEEKPKPLPVVVPEPPAPKEAKVHAPADLGRGGAQHKAIQLRLKEAAEALGFRVHVEKLILDEAGCVDLVIEREGQSIACEITVTTTIDHEIGNVSKCAKAGFREIAAIAVSEDKLTKLEAAVKNSLGPEVALQTRFFLPDAFLAYLRDMPAPLPLPPTERMSHGYRVKRSYVPIAPEEARAKESALIKIIAENMKRTRSKLG